MSGHSKWSTIKHKKAATDAVRAKAFSKLSRAISIAVKTGGGNNPDTNYKLRLAVDAARAENMPKINIEKALSKADSTGDLVEIRYEGMAPGGAGILVETATDNRNRTAQEIKQIFEKGGGRIVNPGAVSFNFEATGLIVVQKESNLDEQMLDLIEYGALDILEDGDELEVYVAPQNTSLVKKSIESKYVVKKMKIIQKPNQMHLVDDKNVAQKIISLVSTLEDADDVQEVFTNASIPDELIED